MKLPKAFGIGCSQSGRRALNPRLKHRLEIWDWVLQLALAREPEETDAGAAAARIKVSTLP